MEFKPSCVILPYIKKIIQPAVNSYKFHLGCSCIVTSIEMKLVQGKCRRNKKWQTRQVSDRVYHGSKT